MLYEGLDARMSDFIICVQKSADCPLGSCWRCLLYFVTFPCGVLGQVWKISSVACGFSSIKMDYSDYLNSLISRVNEVVVFFFNKISR